MDPAGVSADTRVGSLLAGKYRLVRLLGAGGMGAVYEAENSMTRRRVAVKMLLGEIAKRVEIVQRFQQEAQAASRIAHPNIVDVLDMGNDPADGSQYIVQEFLQGEDLRAKLDREGVISVSQTIEIILPVLSALGAAHKVGVIHRDVKPENIFLATTHVGTLQPKLIDFGISKIIESEHEGVGLTRTGTTMGTPTYMSPEQARGVKDINLQTDIWAIGVVMFEMLAGTCPFTADNYNALILEILTAPIPRLDSVAPHVPKSLADAVHGALERDRNVRFRSMEAFMEAIVESDVMTSDPSLAHLLTTYRASLSGGRLSVVGADSTQSRRPVETKPGGSGSVAGAVATKPGGSGSVAGGVAPPAAFSQTVVASPGQSLSSIRRAAERERATAAGTGAATAGAGTDTGVSHETVGPRVTQVQPAPTGVVIPRQVAYAVAAAALVAAGAFMATKFSQHPTTETASPGRTNPIVQTPPQTTIAEHPQITVAGTQPQHVENPVQPTAVADAGTTLAAGTQNPTQPATNPANPTNPVNPTNAANAANGTNPANSGSSHSSHVRPHGTQQQDTPTGTAMIRLSVAPWGHVRVDGRSYGTTPRPPIEVSSGQHTIVISNEEVDVTRTVNVTLSPGDNRLITVDLLHSN